LHVDGDLVGHSGFIDGFRFHVGLIRSVRPALVYDTGV
jgi:hypothetical protein